MCAPRWRGQLDLVYRRVGPRTVLSRREHVGPLRVQKALYPEGPEVCHTLLLHPPAGIAQQDDLRLNVRLEPHSQVLLTQPGATKWYRSDGASATSHTHLHVQTHAALEWMPQETIVFDGARGQARMHVELEAGARYLGLEVITWGRRAHGERFDQGCMGLETRILMDGRPLWLERGEIQGGSAWFDSPLGMQGQTVMGSLVLVGAPQAQALVQQLRQTELPDHGALWSWTTRAGVILGRCLALNGEAVRASFLRSWQHLRPAAFGRAAMVPRIWMT